MEKNADNVVAFAFALYEAYLAAFALGEEAGEPDEPEAAEAIRGTLEKVLEKELGEFARVRILAEFEGKSPNRDRILATVRDALNARDAKELGKIQERIEDLLKGGNGPEGEAELEEILEAARRGGYRPR